MENAYLAICGLHIEPYTAEREVADMTWAGTIKDIAEGQLFPLRMVVEIGTGRDVTKLMALEVMDIWAQRGEPLSYSQREFIELNIGIRAANSFALEDA